MHSIKLLSCIVLTIFTIKGISQKSALSVFANGYVNGNCDRYTMSATIGQTFAGRSSCGPYDILIGFQQPVDILSTPIYDRVFDDLNVYPNPATTLLNIAGKLAGKSTFLTIKITDMLGRQHLFQSLKEYRDPVHLDISHLTNGMYTLTLMSSPTEIQSLLFIKQ